MPLTSAWLRRSSTVPDRQASSSALRLVLLLHRLRERDQALGGVGAPVEQHVLHQLEQVLGDLLVDRELAGVDDAHVHARADRVVQEGGVHGLAHGVVAAEGERDVAEPARDLGQGQGGLDAARRLEERDRVVVVLLDAGGHGQDVRVEDDVLGREADLLGQDPVGAACRSRPCGPRWRPGPPRRRPSPPPPRRSGGRGGACSRNASSPSFREMEFDDALALHALQPGLDHAPLRAVDHDRHAARCRARPR